MNYFDLVRREIAGRPEEQQLLALRGALGLPDDEIIWPVLAAMLVTGKGFIQELQKERQRFENAAENAHDGVRKGAMEGTQHVAQDIVKQAVPILAERSQNVEQGMLGAAKHVEDKIDRLQAVLEAFANRADEIFDAHEGKLTTATTEARNEVIRAGYTARDHVKGAASWIEGVWKYGAWSCGILGLAIGWAGNYFWTTHHLSRLVFGH